MLFKSLLVVVLIVIAISLFSALRTLVRNKDNDKQRTVRFLAIRVGLSVLLLILLALAMFMGWIEPHGLQPQGQLPKTLSSTAAPSASAASSAQQTGAQ